MRFQQIIDRVRESLVPAKKTDIKSVFSGDEISILDLINIFWERRNVVILWVVFFSIFGLLGAITSKDTYSAKTKIISEVDIPDEKNNRRGNISNLAALAGIDVGGSSGGGWTNPLFYPEVARSESFLLELMEEQFYFKKKKKEMSLLEFFVNYDDSNILTLWFNDLKNFRIPRISYKSKSIKKVPKIGFGQRNYKPDSVYHTVTLSGPQRKAIGDLRKVITVLPDEDYNLIEISVTMPEKKVSAQLAQTVLEQLMDYVLEHQTQKEQENLEFIRRRTELAKRKFEATEEKLADFVDSNQNVISARVNIERQKLQSEANIATQIYRQLAIQLEQSEIALQEKTPVYSVFTPTIVPAGPEPQSRIIMIAFIAIGLVLGFGQIVLIIIRTLIRK